MMDKNLGRVSIVAAVVGAFFLPVVSASALIIMAYANIMMTKHFDLRTESKTLELLVEKLNVNFAEVTERINDLEENLAEAKTDAFAERKTWTRLDKRNSN